MPGVKGKGKAFVLIHSSYARRRLPPRPPPPSTFFLPTGCESFAGRLVGFRQKNARNLARGKNCFPGDGNKTECGIGDRVGFCRKCVVVLVQLSGLFCPPLDHRRIHPVHFRGKDRHSQGVTSIWKLSWAKKRCPYIWPPCNLRADRGKVAAAAALSSSSDRRDQHSRSVSGVGFAHHTLGVAHLNATEETVRKLDGRIK